MAGMRKFLLVAVVLGVYQGVQSNNCEHKWRDLTDAISRGSREDFVQSVDPIVQMAKKSYTAEVDENIPGWKLVQEFKLSHGLYAVAYQCESDKSKIVVAFRGIRFGDGMSEGMMDDLCAQYILSDAGKKCSDDKTPLPSTCEGIPAWRLHYLNQAHIFVAQLRAVYKEECFLYTGHSIGSSLAALMSATSSGRSLAIGFASDPSNIAEIAPNLGLSDDDFLNVITIYDKYDSNAALDDSMVGVTCRFEDHPEPEACKTCTANGPFPDLMEVLEDMSTPCGQCVHVTHAFRHILEQIYDDNIGRPQCYEQGWVEIPYTKPTPASEVDFERRLLNLLMKDLVK